ncbi:MAG: agmatinase family protein [Myxococcales bacterium]|nr:agmatinase family protein [Myxococcales bacterium]
MTFDPDAAAKPGSGIFGLPTRNDKARVVLVPVPFDATTSYRAGTSRGPRAILEASRQVELFAPEIGRPYQAGIVLMPEDRRVRAWNRAARKLAEKVIAAGGAENGSLAIRKAADAVNRISESLNRWVFAKTDRLLRAGRIPGILGGDHAVPYGAIAACAERFPGLGILHFDAHADLRRAYEGFTFSHASIMFNAFARLAGVARIVQLGIRDFGQEEYRLIQNSRGQIRTFFDSDLQRALQAQGGWGRLLRRVAESLPRRVYVSFDIDGLDPALCPHTGTPVPGGLSFFQACQVLRAVVESGRTIMGFDLCEVAPAPSGGDEWDGNVGARVLYQLIGWTLRSQDRQR